MREDLGSIPRGGADAPSSTKSMTACDGTPLPTCAPGWTGPSCASRCDGEDCGFTSYCHGDGRTWGIASFGARLFDASASLSDQALHSLFEGFIVEHPEAVGLAPGVSPQDLDLVPARGFRAPAGKLVLLHFDQRYRGIPVYGPDGTVRVTLAPGGAIAFNGAIVDGRDVWANFEQQAGEDAARRSILAHAVERSGLPAEELEVAGLHRVAVPATRRIGWVGTVRSGVAHVVTIVVDGDPEAGVPLPILHAENIEAAGLVDEVDIGVLAEHPATDVFSPPDQTAGIGELFDGSPLRGSTRGAEVIVGTERVVGYDASGAMNLMGLELLPPLASATTAFDAMPGTVAYEVQNHYVRVQSFYSFADRYMAGVWESLNMASSFLPGEFEPRVMLWIDPGFDACEEASYCVNYVQLEGTPIGFVETEYEQPFGGPTLENLAYIAIEPEGVPAHIVAHEFGHVVDLFAAPYTIRAGLGCTGAAGCAPSCQLDTTEEAPTLTETVAQLFAIAATSELYPVATSDNCTALYAISLGDDGAPHNETCRPDGEPYSRFLQVPCPGAGDCDHDFDVGFELGQPTGLCGLSKGYRIDSIHQAFWELFHAESCAATPPYTCTPIGLPTGLSASDAFMPALLYALRVDAKFHRQFMDAFATHVSCNLGTEVYEEVNAVLCGVLACDASCMIDTSMCEVAETGLDETGVTGPGPDVIGSGTSPLDSTGGSVGSTGGGDGCRCSAEPGRGAGFALASLGLFGLVGKRRRRRGHAGVAAVAAVLAGSSAQGCCEPMVATDTSSVGESSSTEDEGSTNPMSTGESSMATGEPVLPEWALGFFSSATAKVGMTWDGQEKHFWYPWGNIEINAEGMLFVDFYVCTELRERQEFRWTSTDGGESLTLESVPPADVFAFGTDEDVSEVVVEPGDSCDSIIIRTFHVEVMSWAAGEYHRGNVCAKPIGDPADCILTLEWCDGVPIPCE